MDEVWHDPRVADGMRAQLSVLNGAPVGWKLGLGSEAAMEAAGTSGPLLGFLTAQTQLDDGAKVDVGNWSNPVVEPEIAIFLGADLGAEPSRDEAVAAIAGIGVAFELVDIDRPINEVEELLAGDIFHRYYILGPSISQRAGGSTSALAFTVTKNGEEVARTDDPEAAVGGLVDLTLHAARYLAAFGHCLRVGQFIISGSIVPPIQVLPGDGVAYSAGDLGSLSLTF